MKHRLSDTLSQLSFILSKRQKKVYVGLFFATLIGSLLEAAAIGMMFPFMHSLLGSGAFDHGDKLNTIYRIINIDDKNELVVIIVCILISIYIIKCLYQIFLQYIQARFQFNTRLTMSVNIFKQTLNKPYAFFIRYNTSDLYRLITFDINNVFTMIKNILILFAEISVSLGIIAVLFFYKSIYHVICFVSNNLYYFNLSLCSQCACATIWQNRYAKLYE